MKITLLFLDYVTNEGNTDAGSFFIETLKIVIGGLAIYFGIWLEKQYERIKEKRTQLNTLNLYQNNISHLVKTVSNTLDVYKDTVDEIINNMYKAYLFEHLELTEMLIIRNIELNELYKGFVIAYNNKKLGIDDYRDSLSLAYKIEQLVLESNKELAEEVENAKKIRSEYQTLSASLFYSVFGVAKFDSNSSLQIKFNEILNNYSEHSQTSNPYEKKIDIVFDQEYLVQPLMSAINSSPSTKLTEDLLVKCDELNAIQGKLVPRVFDMIKLMTQTRLTINREVVKLRMIDYSMNQNLESKLKYYNQSTIHVMFDKLFKKLRLKAKQ